MKNLPLLIVLFVLPCISKLFAHDPINPEADRPGLERKMVEGEMARNALFYGHIIEQQCTGKMLEEKLQSKCDDFAKTYAVIQKELRDAQQGIIPHIYQDLNKIVEEAATAAGNREFSPAKSKVTVKLFI